MSFPMADEIPFVKALQFQYGELEHVAPNVRRLIAKNPSPFTYTGTGTYVVGQGRVAVIDPGPALPEHVDALLHALRGEDVAHILITHTHLDHSPATPLLVARTGAPTFGFGPHARGRHRADDEVEAGADWKFVPDHILEDGDVLEGRGYALEALHTPGHCSNHLCLSLRDDKTLFTGDHVMGWSTSVITPPDGDMGQYMTQLKRLLTRDDARYLPTHGAPIEDPKPLVAALIQHREQREQQILNCLAEGISHITDMVERMYIGVHRGLYPAAARSVFAHLLHLHERGQVIATSGEPSLEAEYQAR
jgi:glyoxylase-like metal-dependent hydrolase (beta-lactamase superfamily II)